MHKIAQNVIECRCQLWYNDSVRGTDTALITTNQNP